MLEVSNVNSFYGRIQALWGVSLRMDEQEIVALIGSNGAGKTTVLNTISGVLHPASGYAMFLNRKIEGMTSHTIVELGISHVPQGGKPFPDMSVRENLEMGAYPSRAWKGREATMGQVFEIFPRLKERQGQPARTLSGGEKQMLAMGRGLMSKPRLCLIDEPSYGLAPIVILELFRVMRSLRNQGLTVLLVEQNVHDALEVSDRAYVIENGRIVLEGSSRELLEQEMIRKAYLGL
ncbi:MAG: ABC transporter ATP-binding protein [Thermodesulfobacteriota bacterium]